MPTQVQVKYSLKNEFRGGVRVQAVCLYFAFWPLRRDDHAGVLIGAGGMRIYDWPARVLADDVSTRIDRYPAREDRSIARAQRQVAANCYNIH